MNIIPWRILHSPLPVCMAICSYYTTSASTTTTVGGAKIVVYVCELFVATQTILFYMLPLQALSSSVKGVKK